MSNTPLYDQPAGDDILPQFFARGGALRMLADIQIQDLQQLYGYANQLFQGGEIAAAKNFYYLLSCMDHWNFDYQLALGLCHQRLSEHEQAIACFSRAGMIKVDDPRAAFFAGLSYQMHGNTEYANKALRAAITWCGVQVEYQPLRDSALKIMAQCQQETST